MRKFRHKLTISGGSDNTAAHGSGCAQYRVWMKPFLSVSLGCALALSGTAALAIDTDSPVTIDDLGFSAAMNEDLFTTRLQVSSESSVKPAASAGNNAGIQLSSMMELESTGNAAGNGTFELDNNNQFEEKEGFRIRRFSTSVKNTIGTLTVGNDWSNFQDFLGNRNSVLQGSETVALGAVTTNQVRWSNNSGLGVAIEQGFTSSDGEDFETEQQSPSLVLSWEGASKTGRGEYRMAALGHEVASDESLSGDDRDVGWGLNLAGGWRFGDLFAKLSLTLGNSIDSFILGRFTDKRSDSDSKNPYRLNQAFSISPSINYQLTEKGKIHLSVNRFQSSENLAANGVDTLDTVNLGYTWTPWPSTRFGIEYVGKDVEGNAELSDSNEVNFAASKQF